MFFDVPGLPNDDHNEDENENDDDDSDVSDESNESEEKLTQAQIDKYEEIADAIWPTEFAWMDADGNCYDHDGHWVEFEYPNEYYGLSDESEYELNDQDDGDEDDNEED